jgi:thiamine monophosphate synthase
MAGRLPFTRLAILEPSLVFAHLGEGPWDRQMAAELRAWHALAQARGADACYARVQALPAAPEVVGALIDAGARVLAPASMRASLPEGVLGWHLRAADPLPDRRDGALLGRSCHSLAELGQAAAEGLDYAFFSPIFSTATHPGAVPLGLAAVAEASASVSIPVVALGGIDHGRGQACLDAGAAAWAGIRCWMRP